MVSGHVPAETISSLSLSNRRDTIKELLEAMFSVGSALRLYNEDTSQAAVSCQLSAD
jgi:hypothetical protein